MNKIKGLVKTDKRFKDVRWIDLASAVDCFSHRFIRTLVKRIQRGMLREKAAN
jgi:hypothetical protein